MARPPCTPMKVDTDGSPRDSSMEIIPSVSGDRPGQPYPVYWVPAMPSSASPGMRSIGNLPRVHHSLMTGSTCSSMNARTRWRSARSSSSSSASRS